MLFDKHRRRFKQVASKECFVGPAARAWIDGAKNPSALQDRIRLLEIEKDLSVERLPTEEEDRIIRLANERCEFYREADGYLVWRSRIIGGCMTSAQLRVIANYLDQENAEWHRHVVDGLAIANERLGAT